MKKNLIALSLVGIMLLPSCVKDIESPSVTAVRDAKAAELQSIAELNNANAQAALTLANAEAALKVAEAKAKEAEAQKLAAETELIKVQAELEAVNVEIAKVKLEEEKVQLEIKKAELEAKLIQLENLKAQAELLQAQVAAELERLSVELEEALLRAKVSLLEAQKAYNQAAADLDNDGLITLANTYFSACEALYEAQSQLAQDKVTLTRLENGLVDLQQAKAEQILANKRQIAQIKTYAEKLEGLRSTPIEDLMAMESEALSAMLDAYIVADERAEELGAAEDAWWDAYTKIINNPYSKLDPFIVNIPDYRIDIYGFIDENNNWARGFYHEGEMVKLISAYSVETEDIEIEGNLFTNIVFKPVVADKDAFDLLISDIKAAENEMYENNIEWPTTALDNNRKSLERYTAALENLEPIVAEYQAAYDAAVAAYEATEEPLNAAWEAYLDYIYEHYNVSNAALSDAWAKYNEAVNAENAARDELSRLRPESEIKSDIENWEENVVYGERRLAEAEDAVSEDDAAAVETAQAKVDAQKAVVDAKQAAYDAAYAAMRAAKLAWIADPTAEKEAAYNEAETARSEAEAVLVEESGKLNDFIIALNDAKDVYQNELDQVERANSDLVWNKEMLESYRTELENRKAAEQKLEEAIAASEQAYETVEAAQAQLDDDDEEKQALWEAFVNCNNESNEAMDAMSAAESALEDAKRRCRYDNYVSWISSAEDEISYFETFLENENARHEAALAAIAEDEQAFAEMFAEEAAYNAAVTELNDVLMAAWKDAFAAYVIAENEADEAEAQYDAIAAALDNEISLEEYITDCEAEIADLEAENADLSRIESQEILIERYKNRIAALETKVSILETKVAEAKEALDAASATE